MECTTDQVQTNQLQSNDHLWRDIYLLNGKYSKKYDH